MRILLLSLLFLIPSVALGASQGYQMLEPLPFVKASDGKTVTFTDLLNGLFTLSLALGAAGTAVMLTLGGVQYMTSDAVGAKQAGRDRIRNALLGFFLLFGVYVILQTINPELLNLRLLIAPVGKEYAQRSSTIDRTIRNLDEEERAKLKAAGIPEGVFTPSMELPGERLNDNKQPVSERAKNYAAACRLIGRKVIATEDRGPGQWILSCVRP